MMISVPILALLLCAYITIGLLPQLFFRADGNFNLRWVVTAAPFFLMPLLLILGSLGVISATVKAAGLLYIASQVVAVLLSVASVALIAMTVGSHRIPLALWHQDNDAPQQLVTGGPYAWMRHPFYTGFMLTFAATVVSFPHWSTAGCLIYGCAALSVTARGEEALLLSSEFGKDYRYYMSMTGRFFPRRTLL